MSKLYAQNNVPTSNSPESIFQGAIIDESGNEVTITEQMIQDACAALEKEAVSIYQDEVFYSESILDKLFNDESLDLPDY